MSSILGYTIAWDRRNDPITPTRGWDLRVSQDLAGLGGDVKYLRSDVRGTLYRGIFPSVVATASFIGSYIQGWGGEEVQVNDRFFRGSNDFRGFDTAGIGPRVVQRDAVTGEIIATGNAVGGNLVALAEAELSFPLPVPTLDASPVSYTHLTLPTTPYV